MTREEFMKELEYLLQDIQDDEKEDAIQYYRDYFDEAGPENEESVVREFGSPERVAAIIRSDLAGNLEDGGEFTESGYQDGRFRDPGYQVAHHYDLPEPIPQAGSRPNNAGGEPAQPKTNRTLKLVLIVILVLVAAPVMWGIGEGIIAAGGTLLGLVVLLVLMAGLVTLIFLILGVVLVPAGIVCMFTGFWDGLLLFGSGVTMLGIALLGVALSMLFYGRFLPFLFRTVADGINRLVHRLRGNS